MKAKNLLLIGLFLFISSTVFSQITITVNQPPVVTLTSDDADNIVCPGALVTYTLLPTGLSSYTFTNKGSIIYSGPNNTYTANIIDGDVIGGSATNASGCIGTATPITMTVVALPTLTLTSDAPGNTICFGDPVTYTLLPTGLSSYTFTNKGSIIYTGPNNTYTQTNVADGDVIGGYGTSGAGCTVTAANITMTVVALPVPTVVSQTNPTSCGGSNGSITVDGAGVGGSYSWNTVPVQTIATASGLTAGTYTCTVTNSTGCSKDITVILSDPAAPIVTMTSSDVDNVICSDESVTVTLLPTGLSNYVFTVDGTVVYSGVNNIYTTTGLVDGNIIGGSASNASGCTGTAMPIDMTVNSLPVPTILSQTNPTSCGGSNGSITVDGAGVGGNYSWNTVPIQTTATASGLTAGTYTCTVTNSTGCSKDITVILSDPAAPIVTMTSSDVDNVICSDESVTVTLLPTGLSNYVFTVDGTVVYSGVNNIYTTTGLVDGNIIGGSASNASGCTGTAPAITMSVNALPTATFGANQAICEGDVIGLTVNPNGVAPFSVLLLNGTADLVAPNNINPVSGVGVGGTATFTVQPTTTTTYHFRVTDGNSCSKDF